MTYKRNISFIFFFLFSIFQLSKLSFSQAKVVINEFLSTPVYGKGLPNAEFIELKNISTTAINIKNWKISDKNRDVQITTDVILQPDSCIILTSTSNINDFKSFGRVIGVKSFPILNNSGDDITLTNDQGNIEHTLTYDNTWADDSKKSNGWSFELIDPDKICIEKSNWKYSTNSVGGTPGKENSIFKKSSLIPSFECKDATAKFNAVSITFSQHIDTATFKMNAVFSDSNGISYQYNLSTTNSPTYQLTFPTPFDQNMTYYLNIPRIISCSQHDTILSVTKVFCYKNHWQNCDTLPKPTFRDVIITEVLFQSDDNFPNTKNEFIEIFNRSSKKINLKGWLLADATDTISIINNDLLLYPDSIIILTGKDFYITTNNNIIHLNHFPILNNDNDKIKILTSDFNVMDTFTYKSSDFNHLKKGFSVQLINKTSHCLDVANWYVDTIHKISPLSFFNMTDSNISFSFNTIMESQLKILYSKKLSQVTNPSISLMTDAKERFNFVQRVDDDTLIISFNENLNAKNEYALVLNSIHDCVENVYSLNDTYYLYFDYILKQWNIGSMRNDLKMGDIAFNEFMFKPSGNRSLPEVEYVELMNLSDTIVAISELIFCKEDNCQRLEKYSLKQDSILLILASDGDVFNEYKNKITLEKNITLTNEKGNYFLRDRKGQIIHFVQYDNSNYSDDFKSKGGYSLELINPKYIFSNYQSWAYSNDKNGGTPSKINSYKDHHYEDFTLPYITYALADSSSILVFASKTLHPQIGQQFKTLINPISLLDIDTTYFFDEYGKVIKIDFKTALEVGELYQFIIDTLYDYYGNYKLKDTLVAGLFNDEVASGDIIINEVLFNASENNAEYIELYNTSNKMIDLKNIKLAVHNKDNTINEVTYCSDNSFPILPKSYEVLTKNKQLLTTFYSPIAQPKYVLSHHSFPTLKNDKSFISLLDKNDNKIDGVYYNENFHHELIQNYQDVSLERVILSPSSSTTNIWYSSAYPNYATPTRVNSQRISGKKTSNNKKIFVSNNTISPDGDGHNDFTEITIKPKDLQSVVELKIFSHDGILVKTIANLVVIGDAFTAIWKGLNHNGNVVPSGAYILQVIITSTTMPSEKHLTNIFVINK